MNINAAFPSRYLKAADLGDATPIVTIDRVAVEEVGQEREHRPVVYFVGKQKGVVLNKSNAAAIAQLAGPETEEWPGTQVQLYVAMVSFRGEEVEAIRIRAPRPVAAAPKPKPQPVNEPLSADEIPF